MHRHNNWFWNSKLMNWFAAKVSKLSDYLWRKRFSKK
jgi:hypothetical protein